MKAVKLCVSKDGILYVDQSLKCWLFQKQDNGFLPLQSIGTLLDYMANGFGNVNGELLRRMAIQLLATVEGFIDIDYEYQNVDPPCIIDEVKSGIHYSDTDTRWYDQLMFRSILTEDKDRPKNLFVFKDIFYNIENNAVCMYNNEDLDLNLNDWRFLSNAEIDNLKSGVTDPEWFLKPFEPVLCHVHEQYPNSLSFISAYNPKSELFDIYDLNDRHHFKESYAKPVSNEFLDGFKTSI